MAADTLERVKKIIVDQLGVDAEKVTANARFREEVEAEDPQPLHALSAQAGELLSEAQRLPAAQRRRFLCKQLSAMQTTLRILAGERIAFRDEVQGLYDISPARVDDALFETALKEL